MTYPFSLALIGCADLGVAHLPTNQLQLLVVRFDAVAGIGIDQQNNGHHGNGRNTDGAPQGAVEQKDHQRRNDNDDRYGFEHHRLIFANGALRAGDLRLDELGRVGFVGSSEAGQPRVVDGHQSDADNEQRRPDSTGPSGCRRL